MQIAPVQVPPQQAQLRSAYVPVRPSRLCGDVPAEVSYRPPETLHAVVAARRSYETRLVATRLLVTPQDTEEGWSADRSDSCSTRRCDPSMEPKYGAKSRQTPVQQSPSNRCVLGSCCLHSSGLQIG